MKLFISYAREDTDYAEYLNKNLKDKGHDVLIDVNSIRFGSLAYFIEKKGFSNKNTHCKYRYKNLRIYLGSFEITNNSPIWISRTLTFNFNLILSYLLLL